MVPRGGKTSDSLVDRFPGSDHAAEEFLQIQLKALASFLGYHCSW